MMWLYNIVYWKFRMLIFFIGIIIASIEFVKKYTEEVISILVCALVVGISILIAHIIEKHSEKSSYSSESSQYKDIHAALTHKDSFTRYPVYDLNDLKRHVSELYTVNSFSIWDAPFYKNEPQRLRFNRAKYQTITFLVTDPELNAGICMSTRNISERYMVTLVDCTCEDFKKHAHPCKHMYALALKLGVIDKEYHLYPFPEEHADALRKAQRESYNSLYEFKRILEIADRKRKFIEPDKILVHTEFHPHLINILEQNNLLSVADPKSFDFIEHLTSCLTIEQFKNAALSVNPVCYFPPHLVKKDLFEYVCSNSPEICKKLYKMHSHVIIDYGFVALQDEYIDFIDYELIHIKSFYY